MHAYTHTYKDTYTYVYVYVYMYVCYTSLLTHIDGSLVTRVIESRLQE